MTDAEALERLTPCEAARAAEISRPGWFDRVRDEITAIKGRVMIDEQQMTVGLKTAGSDFLNRPLRTLEQVRAARIDRIAEQHARTLFGRDMAEIDPLTRDRLRMAAGRTLHMLMLEGAIDG